MVTPEEIRNVTFEKQSMGGYRRADVDSFLQEAADALEKKDKENSELQQKLVVLAQKIEEYRADEDNVKTALLNAQRMAENIIREAKQKSDAMLRDAGIKADDVIQNAREQVESEEKELERVQAEVSAFKSGILQMYRQHIELLQKLPDVEEKSTENTETTASESAQNAAELGDTGAVSFDLSGLSSENSQDVFQGIKFSD